jgi:hypothetical protein
MVKVPRRFERLLFAIMMSLCTALIVSGAVVYMHGVPTSQFINVWMVSFLTAWPIVFLSILILAPQISRLLNILLEK